MFVIMLLNNAIISTYQPEAFQKVCRRHEPQKRGGKQRRDRARRREKSLKSEGR